MVLMNESRDRTNRAAGPDRGPSSADLIEGMPMSTDTHRSRPATMGRGRREADATRFLIASLLLTAAIFGLINVVVHFSESAHTAGAVVTAPSQATTSRPNFLSIRADERSGGAAIQAAPVCPVQDHGGRRKC
jgi:hypothetical protein